MAKRMKAYVIGAPDSDREVSGIRSRPAGLGPESVSVPAPERQTARVPRVDLERLIAEQRALADEEDRTVVAPPESVTGPHSTIPASLPPDSQETTVKLRAPEVVAGTPSPLGEPDPLTSDFPPPIEELTAVMKFTPVPIPPPSIPPFEAMREARDEARLTKRIVVTIWALALTLIAILGYVVAAHG